MFHLIQCSKEPKALLKTQNWKTFRTSKGAPHIILKLVGNADIEKRVEEDVTELGLRGIRSLLSLKPTKVASGISWVF